MERRTHARIGPKLLSQVPVTFSGNAHGKGTLYDLSTGGCKVETRNTPALGASLTLQLAVSPEIDPIKIDAAIVGWTIKGQYFGVKFVHVEPTERLLLAQCIARLTVRGSELV
jgi:c-di-GMP-binding flagellar brake protein YcgR